MISRVTSALLLLHGFTHTGASWEPVIATLGERYRALAPDLRGHGTASDARPVTLETVIGDLARIAPPRYVLGGYSMGGRIALHLALAHPGPVERLVLIGATPGIADEAERAQRRRDDEQLAAEIDSSEIEDFARRWARTPLLGGLPDEVAARTHDDRLRSTPAGLALALRGLGNGALPSLWDRLSELRMPVKLVVGERDGKFREIAEQMRAAIAGAEVIVVPGAGHAAHLEAPQRVAEIIAGER
jgi:2-succinyl-6-hydroxy-2,4-cyclohexadiene-1-carboxylate synthase